jgi:hypothetical protein
MPVQKLDERKQPAKGPKIIRTKLDRVKKDVAPKGGKNHRPEPHSPIKEQRPNPKCRPGRQQKNRELCQAHPSHSHRVRADPSQDRRKSEVKERHVIIEKVAILHEVARPPPYNVEMLGLVAVVAVAENIRPLQTEQDEHQTHCHEPLRPWERTPGLHSETPIRPSGSLLARRLSTDKTQGDPRRYGIPDLMVVAPALHKMTQPA